MTMRPARSILTCMRFGSGDRAEHLRVEVESDQDSGQDGDNLAPASSWIAMRDCVQWQTPFSTLNDVTGRCRHVHTDGYMQCPHLQHGEQRGWRRKWRLGITTRVRHGCSAYTQRQTAQTDMCYKQHGNNPATVHFDCHIHYLTRDIQTTNHHTIFEWSLQVSPCFLPVGITSIGYIAIHS